MESRIYGSAAHGHHHINHSHHHQHNHHLHQQQQQYHHQQPHHQHTLRHNPLHHHQPHHQHAAPLPPPPSAATTTHQLVFTVRLDANGGPLGITLSGSESEQKPILISALLEAGCAALTGQIAVGDALLAINGESVQAGPLSRATRLLQQSIGGGGQQQQQVVELKLARNISGTFGDILIHCNQSYNSIESISN